MKLGIDFDNTIVCYDYLFYREALSLGLIPKGLLPNKNLIREYVRGHEGENQWVLLQSIVYGKNIHDAEPFPGIIEFIRQARNYMEICIISHKTNSTILDKEVNLIEAAKRWLHVNKISQLLPDHGIYFENSRENKISRIKEMNCDLFIDDLLDIFLHHNFPDKTQKILFDPFKFYRSNPNINTVSSWAQINNLIQNIKMD